MNFGFIIKLLNIMHVSDNNDKVHAIANNKENLSLLFIYLIIEYIRLITSVVATIITIALDIDANDNININTTAILIIDNLISISV